MLVCAALSQRSVQITQTPKRQAGILKGGLTLVVQTRGVGPKDQLCTASHSAALPVNTRREALLSAAAVLASLCNSPRWAHSSPLRSVRSDLPCVLTVSNASAHLVKCYWLNYDGDAEFFAAIPPGRLYTIDTYATHPWLLVDAESGKVLQQYVADGQDRLVKVGGAVSSEGPDLKEQTEVSPEVLPSEPRSFTGFDGLGGDQDLYALAELEEVALDMTGAVATLSVDGFEAPVPIYIGIAEAAAILYASGVEMRRPSTVGTWRSTLEAAGASVERVVITRLVGHTFYARIVLALLSGGERSVDARPSDSLALALQWDKPVYVAKELARAQQLEGLLENELDGLPLPLGPGLRKQEMREKLLAGGAHVRQV
ncbi:hypothetical protein WJX72_004295 [[Myrmecia] bisecta]|uniref:BFN domain-containing protein n=1 Tax=[Myrmecia] bisecta TaxID=41462 RepID=A0AAW1Q400_9CHLO